MATTTSSVYIHVVEDVIDKVRNDFIEGSGPGESVLNELQALWEMKMMQCGAIMGPIERSSGQKPAAGGPITPVHDLNVPYEGTEEYETPTADMLFPPTPLQTLTPLPTTPIQTPLPGTVDNSMYQLTPGPNDFPSVQNTGGGTETKPGRPSPYMQPPSPWMNQRPLGVDVNVAYVEGRDELDRGASHQPATQDFFVSSGKRKREDFAPQFQTSGFIPQQDGAGDVTLGYFEAEVNKVENFPDRCSRVTRNDEVLLAPVVRASSWIPQQDGPIPDAYDEIVSTPNLYPYQGVASEDYNAVNTPAGHDLQAGTPVVGTQNEIVEADDEDEPLNENDDDEVDDVDEGDEPNTQHLVLAQFDKVTRTKSRWKCTLKDGIMHINNKDVLFTKATGEFDF
ncbi:transcription initiation factor IIA large subunit-like [Macadamia integrifolia]|uniref:transcription initiation factor IIA large subunit-like n=1 Tax=Macadamia integrifolia TaxID=60698 RepID=UPI001C52C4C0|nr:transcription initiation factor IIA large subunit-like [Macadamia integrifolia]